MQSAIPSRRARRRARPEPNVLSRLRLRRRVAVAASLLAVIGAVAKFAVFDAGRASAESVLLADGAAVGPAGHEDTSATPPEQCNSHQGTSPPSGGTPVAEPPAEPPPPEIEWAGRQDDPPVRPSPPEEALPTGIAFQKMTEKLGHLFTTMKLPPHEKAYERYFQEYTDNLSTKLQLEGDRADLSIVRLMFFDRRTQNPRDLSSQNETFVRFLQAVGADARQSDEVLKFIEHAGTPNGPPHEEQDWQLSDNRLVVSITSAYGSGVIEVRHPHPKT